MSYTVKAQKNRGMILQIWQAINNHELDDLTTREIADITKIDIATVQSVLNKSPIFTCIKKREEILWSLK